MTSWLLVKVTTQLLIGVHSNSTFLAEPFSAVFVGVEPIFRIGGDATQRDEADASDDDEAP